MADNELTVEQRLKTLYDLQTIYSHIDRIKDIQGELPREVRDIEDSIQGLNTRILNFKQEIEELRKRVNQENADIHQAKINIERYQAQSNDVRNNREFDALNKEIENEKLTIGVAEKNISELTREVESRKAQIEETKLAIDDRTHTLEEKKQELREIESESAQELEDLRQQREQLEVKFDDRDRESGKDGPMMRLLTAFKRIRKNARNGLGIVCIQREACGGCFNRIPPQTQMEIKLHKKVKVCEYCGRIMIDPVLAGEVTEEEEQALEKEKEKGKGRKKA